MQSCVKPAVNLETNKDLIILIGDLFAALDACNYDKQQLREWSEDAS